VSMLLAVGILSQPALAFDQDHTNFATFLDGAVSDAGVDYATLKTRKATLDTYLGEIANAPVSSFSKEQQLAFYVNAYNAITINLILTENPKSIQDIDGGQVWKQRSWPVGRQKLSLDTIENGKVRKLGDGRIHGVINCASKGCPPLPPKPVLASSLDSQLNEGARRWVRVNAFKLDGSIAQLSKVFSWYSDDFTDLPPGTASDADKLAAGAKFITKYGGDLSAAKTYEWADYDWNLNAQ